MTFTFSYANTKFETLDTLSAQTGFFNMKNKLAGPRAYGYVAYITRATNGDGVVAFRADYQTTLDGARYQSSKHSDWVATEDEARGLLAKTIAGALKRYARLALDPTSRIERVAA